MIGKGLQCVLRLLGPIIVVRLLSVLHPSELQQFGRGLLSHSQLLTY